MTKILAIFQIRVFIIGEDIEPVNLALIFLLKYVTIESEPFYSPEIIYIAYKKGIDKSIHPQIVHMSLSNESCLLFPNIF